MIDPFFPAPAFLAKLTQPIADALYLTTLPLHIHEIILAVAFYHYVHTKVGPALSSWLFPGIYSRFPTRTKINWDVHVVSFVQSVLVNSLALWVMMNDEERSHMDWRERVWGYTGAGGLTQALAAGYFLWDLQVTAFNVGIFGWGMLAHAVSAVVVFSFGFRPFVNYYGPTFILYELSSPFLNIHWFLDKVNMTGSKMQWYNGILLLSTFFGCRLVWGTYQSVRVYQDVWSALQTPGAAPATTLTPDQLNLQSRSDSEIMRFAGPQLVPAWLAITYLGSNIVLNTLNFYWFGKMIETVRKRFQPAEQEKAKLPPSTGPDVSSSMDIFASGKQAVNVGEKEVRQRHA
ncbi:MAG: SWI/SNF complex component snf12 [Chaenotheca gracillima]|nr:MAG: SWI/SNF complex component snf12 [Chaenotheca gracillima]